MRKLLLSLSILSLTALSACKDAPVEVVPDPTIRAGSMFTFEHNVFEEDTTWTNVTATDTTTYTVASIDTAFANQLNAHYLWSLTDTSIYRLDANKNIAVYQPEIEIPQTGVSYPASWPVLPIVTKEALVVEFDEDTIVTIQTLPAIVHTRLTSGYIGEGTVVINGKTYVTKEAFIERNVGVGVQGQVATTRVYNQFSYSPELKTFVAYKQKVWSNHNFSPIPNGGETWTLVKFTL